MTRRCSHCGNDGHNLRTCPNKVVKVFGVRFDRNQTAPIRRSVSMGNLSQHVESGGASGEILNGYASDGFDHDSSRRERKKGMAWTKEEHKHFLLGLEVFGKGDWRGIARVFVPSRTPTQVASHAQKYFNRLNHHQILRRRRFSVFDMALEELDDARTLSERNQENESGADALTIAVAPPPFPPPPPSPPPPQHLETMLMDMPLSATNAPSIVKPTAVRCTSSTNLNELVGMTTLDLFEKGNESSASAYVDIVPNSNRHSAFHSRSSPIQDGSGSPINLNLSPIHAV